MTENYITSTDQDCSICKSVKEQYRYCWFKKLSFIKIIKNSAPAVRLWARTKTEIMWKSPKQLLLSTETLGIIFCISRSKFNKSSQTTHTIKGWLELVIIIRITDICKQNQEIRLNFQLHFFGFELCWVSHVPRQRKKTNILWMSLK